MNIIPFVHGISWGNLSRLADVLNRTEIDTLFRTDQASFGRELGRQFPELAEIGAHILHELNGPAGLCVIDDLQRLDIQPEALPAAFVALCHQVGVPTSHNDDHQVVWHVRDRADSLSREVTFSERAGEAPFHTDSAFAIQPEAYFGLYTVTPAECGGGVSRIIPATRLLAAMNATEEGRYFRQILERELFPFKVPAAFSETGRVVFGKVLNNGKLRYRYDAIRRGIEAVPARVTAAMTDALTWFDAFVETAVPPIEIRLGAGQAIFVNNQRVLHARSNYTDTRRHLLRVRMHAHGQAMPVGLLRN